MSRTQLQGTRALVQLAAVSSREPLTAVLASEQVCAGALQVKRVATHATVPEKTNLVNKNI